MTNTELKNIIPTMTPTMRSAVLRLAIQNRDGMGDNLDVSPFRWSTIAALEVRGFVDISNVESWRTVQGGKIQNHRFGRVVWTGPVVR
jgi:hypothetical protein